VTTQTLAPLDVEVGTVVMEDPVSELRCQASHHDFGPVTLNCGVKAVALFDTRCTTGEATLVCEPLAAACDLIFADPANRCDLCQTTVLVDWIITRL
jgi:hypothetical protein